MGRPASSAARPAREPARQLLVTPVSRHERFSSSAAVTPHTPRHTRGPPVLRASEEKGGRGDGRRDGECWDGGMETGWGRWDGARMQRTHMWRWREGARTDDGMRMGREEGGEAACQDGAERICVRDEEERERGVGRRQGVRRGGDAERGGCGRGCVEMCMRGRGWREKWVHMDGWGGRMHAGGEGRVDGVEEGWSSKRTEKGARRGGTYACGGEGRSRGRRRKGEERKNEGTRREARARARSGGWNSTKAGSGRRHQNTRSDQAERDSHKEMGSDIRQTLAQLVRKSSVMLVMAALLALYAAFPSANQLRAPGASAA
ncbi:hypothetical protein B0H10DRAFT_2113552 [Mycena sp. CBHHK59/15]|nr:hypothetical protein B0H10DRAFT_2113552 [Mycena sp. CBHHK59/15]